VLNAAGFDANSVSSYFGLTDENLVHNPRVRDIAAAISRQRSDVLDVGCGFGTFFHLLGDGVRYEGIDIALPKDGGCQPSRENCRLQWADCCKPFPFEAGSFENVVSFWCLEHVGEPRRMLTEMARVLKPGGKLYLIFPNYDNPLRRCPSFWCDLGEDDSLQSLRRDFKFTRALRQVYRRAGYFVRQWAKQMVLDCSRLSVFEINKDPAYKYLPWARDRDAIHIVSGRSVTRFLTRAGLRLLETNNNPWSSRIFLLGSFFRREPEYALVFEKQRLPSSSS
jgi:SAM-dependent methyltransferase